MIFFFFYFFGSLPEKNCCQQPNLPTTEGNCDFFHQFGLLPKIPPRTKLGTNTKWEKNPGCGESHGGQRRINQLRKQVEILEAAQRHEAFKKHRTVTPTQPEKAITRIGHRPGDPKCGCHQTVWEFPLQILPTKILFYLTSITHARKCVKGP